MKGKRWIIFVIVIILVLVLGLKRGDISIITPNQNLTSRQTVEIPIATPNTPKQYNFDSSTDLEMELESINPQVLESDFEL